MIRRFLRSGVSVFRFNMKHNTQTWHSRVMGIVRQEAKELGVPVAILMDLQGPEIRIGQLEEKIRLTKGEEVFFGKKAQKDKKTVTVDNLKLLSSLPVGEKVFIDDGRLEMRVLENKNGWIRVKVLKGGILSSRKGINFSSIQVAIPTLFAKDFENISMAAKEDVDFIALSFVRDRKDIQRLKKEMASKNLEAQIIAKIETEKSLLHFEEILEATDGVMVARGDLGVELPLEQVPFWQKKIIRLCREAGKPVITATEMLQSMVESSRPTRAEVSDVANAIYDGTDALMLSAETATGEFPHEAVEMMAKTARFLEDKVDFTKRNNFRLRSQSEVVVKGAYDFIHGEFRMREPIKGFVILTESGRTARLLARMRPNLPVFALTRSRKTRDQLALSWGVVPFYYPFKKKSEESIQAILQFLKDEKMVKKDDLVVMVYGQVWGEPGLISTARLQPVP